MRHFRIQEIVKITRSTFSLVMRAIQTTGLKGRIIDGTRMWTESEVKEIDAEINV